MTRILSLLLALSVSLALWAQPRPELTNPGFETAAQDGAPAGWSRYVTFPGTARLLLDRQVKLSGQSALKVEIGDKSRCAVSQLVSVPQPGPYTFSAQLRLPEPATTVAQLQIQWFQTVKWPEQIRLVRTEEPSALFGEAGEWAELATTAQRPAEADLALVAVLVGNGNTPAGSVWVDDARWRPGAFPGRVLTNPGFEADTDADGLPDGWTKAVYGGGFEIGRDTMVAHSGKASGRLTGAKEHGDRAALYQATPLFQPPDKLRLSFWYRGTGTSALIMHLLTPAGIQKAGGGIEYAVMTASPPLKDEWQQFCQEIEVPAEARQAGIMRVDIILYQRGEGTLWYDDVKLEMVK